VRAGPITPTQNGVRLHLRVQPRASRDEVAGVVGDVIRVRLTAPPVDGAANEALLRFLAGCLELTRSSVTLVSGHASRNKVAEVGGLSREEVARRLGL
jgi:uncharacterized protein